jgi:hypothetical protein
MARPNGKAILNAARTYLQHHPEEIVRALRGALGLRIGVPLDALRYFAKEASGSKKAPRDIEIESAPPGLRVALTVEAAGSTLRVSQIVYVEEVLVTADEVRVALRISDLSLKVLEGFQTPVAALVQSGALDLSKPGNLVAFFPKKPAMIVDSKDDRIVLDILKLPKVADNRRVRRALAITTPVLGVRAIRSKDDHLDVYLRATLSGIPSAFAAARA